MSWKYESSLPIPGRFVNDGRNIYTTRGIYFLSDAGTSRQVAPVEFSENGEGSPVDKGYACYKHEVDLSQGLAHSGQTFWGESFLPSDRRTQTFTYRAPGATEGTKAVLGLRFNALAWLPSTVHMSMDGSKIGQSSINARSQTGYTLVHENNIQMFQALAPKPEGEVTINWQAPPCDIQEASLDYFILTYERALDFASGESQFDVQALVTDNPSVTIPQGNGVVCWDVTDPAAAQRLQPDGGVARIPYGPRKLVYFDTDKSMMAPEIIGSVTNYDLRAEMLALNPELVIITTPEFKARAEQLADFHRVNDKMSVGVALIEDIYNSYSAGRPDPMAYRSMLRNLYDAPGSRLRALLLYGPQRSDVRQTNAEEKRDAVIVYQNPNASELKYCSAFTDIYGIFSNSLAKYISTEQMSISVASMPVVSDAEAERYYNKVVRYYFDDSRAYWMERLLLTADDMDYNSHLRQVEDIASRFHNLSDSTLVYDRVYFSEYGNPGVKQPLYDAFKQGSSYSLYIGHGSPVQIGKAAPMINSLDIRNFRNPSLSFMSWSSCETTLYEIGARGISEHMVLSTDDGLIGMFGTVRTAFAHDNLDMMRSVTSMMMNLPDATTGRNPEYGEVIRRAKNSITGIEGKYKFHLMCDPVLRTILPSMKLNLTKSPAESVPGGEATFEGRVTTPAGNTSSDFNGTIVLKWYHPAHTEQSHSKVANQIDTALRINYEHEVAATQAFTVKNGRFGMTAVVPDVMRQFAGQNVRLTLTAYDPEKRLGGTWSGYTAIDAASGGIVSSDTQAPVIASMEAEGGGEGYMLPPEFTLRIEASDDNGLRIDEKSFDAPLRLSIDGKPVGTGIASYATMEEGARRMTIRYPLRGLSTGRHSAMITVMDYAGNSSSHEYIFEVGSPASDDAPLLAESACRSNATFSLPESLDGYAESPVLVITDAYGKELASIPWQGTRHIWPLTDAKGNRVAPGLYKAFVRFTDSMGRSAVTRGRYVPVLALK